MLIICCTALVQAGITALPQVRMRCAAGDPAAAAPPRREPLGQHDPARHGVPSAARAGHLAHIVLSKAMLLSCEVALE